MKKSFILLLSIIFFAWSCTSSEDEGGIPSIGGVNITTNTPGTDEILRQEMLGVDFTGTWCGWCTRAAVDIDRMHDENPNSFNVLAIHVGDSKEVDAIADNYTDEFGVTGYPAVYADWQEAKMPNNDNFYPSLNNHYSNMSDGANVAVALDAKLEGNTMSYVLSFTGEEASYKYIVFSTANGYTGTQTNYSSDLGGSSISDFPLDWTVETVESANNGQAFTIGSDRVFRTDASTFEIPDVTGITHFFTVVILDEDGDYENSQTFQLTGMADANNEIHVDFETVQ